MINLRVGDRPVMFAYELLAKCKHLTLVGVDDDGDLRWVGAEMDWKLVEKDCDKALS